MIRMNSIYISSILILVIGLTSYSQEQIAVDLLKLKFEGDTMVLIPKHQDSIIAVKVKTYKNGSFVFRGTIDLYHYYNDSLYDVMRTDTLGHVSFFYRFFESKKNGKGWYMLNDTIRVMANYENNLLNGLQIKENINSGRLCSIENFINDTVHGQVVEFYDNGELKVMMTYDKGNPIGKYIKFFYRSGQIKQEGMYNGVFSSKLDFKSLENKWFFNGQLVNFDDVPKQILEEFQLTNEFSFFVKSGIWFEYSAKGNVIEKFDYRTPVVMGRKKNIRK